MIFSARTVALISLSLVPLCALAADDQEQSTAARQARLVQIRGVLETLQPTVLREDREERAGLHTTPLLLYADNARDLTNSSLWVWEYSGQPVGVTALEWHVSGENKNRWTFEFATLCPDKIRIALPAAAWTAASARGAPITNSPAIAESQPQRVQQMKQLAERFSAFEQHVTEGRVQLRRLSAPVYTQPKGGDSAIFVFANGTNPEIALLITAAGDGKRAGPWSFRAAALSSTELTLLLDEQKVWSEVRFTRPGTRATYTNGVLPDQSDTR
jgi:hypothetical protein